MTTEGWIVIGLLVASVGTVRWVPESTHDLERPASA